MEKGPAAPQPQPQPRGDCYAELLAQGLLGASAPGEGEALAGGPQQPPDAQEAGPLSAIKAGKEPPATAREGRAKLASRPRRPSPWPGTPGLLPCEARGDCPPRGSPGALAPFPPKEGEEPSGNKTLLPPFGLVSSFIRSLVSYSR